MTALSLDFSLSFNDLYSRSGLVKLDEAFVTFLRQNHADIHNKLVEARAKPEALDIKDEGNLVVEIAPHLEDFIGRLFRIQKEVRELRLSHNALADLFSCKRLFVQRRALKLTKADPASLDGASLTKTLEEAFGEALTERSFAKHVVNWMENEEAHLDKLTTAAEYTAWALENEEGKALHSKGVLFKRPKKLDFEKLVPAETEVVHGVTMLKLNDHHLRERNGFALTDDGGSLERALDNAHYCIYCHNQGKDSCSKGLREKTGEFKKSPTSVTLNGCPLEEKISEMNKTKADGFAVGALAITVIDNPMCAGTGHRICNDCMKACVYQKQDPVDIPQLESHNLRSVLGLPWGFEIYSLFTRWNPLNFRRPLPKADTGRKVLVAGLGPAGYTLAHHLMNDGHTVVGIDGLKIEPLPSAISGITQTGERVGFAPIKDVYAELFEKLDERTLAGFGGVAEYGITVRWDKNFLKVIRLLLERRAEFRMYGGVRFGGTLTYNQAFELGFDHIALCMGAGRPTVLDIPNGLARGVRTASDFLMSLQLSGAAKKESIANLQLRLPVVVVGGGLTGIDTTTESLAYYPIQVEKFLSRYETLVAEHGRDTVRARWTEEEMVIAEEFITHARRIRSERTQAAQEGREADIISLLKSWGGSTLAYRRDLTDAPSYRLNHEEVEKAMEEGIYFLGNATPIEVEVDRFGAAMGLKVRLTEGETSREVVLPARTILMAAGTSPNTVLQRETPEHFELDGKYFQAIDAQGNKVSPEWVAKPETPQMFVSRYDDGRLVSFFGDLHPSYAGNVVKAMGSAKQGYPFITNALLTKNPANSENAESFFAKLDGLLVATVHDVIRLTPNIVEVVVKAPLAARNFEPGQFYRLQNYEANALRLNHSVNTTLAMEGLALTGASTDQEQGLLSTIVLEMGGSSSLCYHLQKGEPIILMGPTGTPTETPGGETVMLVGGGLGNAVLFSIGKALKEAGSKVLYFAGYKKAIDRYKIKEIEEASDIIIWCCDEASFSPERPKDRAFHGNIVQAIEAYGKGMLGKPEIPLSAVDRMVVIGSDRMMAAVKDARKKVLKELLKPDHEAVGSINSPMQCMMKEICAQCLQKHTDPATGKVTYVYSCFNQDQCLDKVDFIHLNERLKQNTVQEKLTAQWIAHCLAQPELLKKVA
jgi:NADPH-dependent glutamate synthase beta subunit-like oxidoreductase/NAD(P)H-flavin reductase